MRAVYIKRFVESLDEVQPTSIEDPVQPKNTKEPHYLVRITHTSPTHVDTLYARGLHQNNHPERGIIHPPFVLGTEFVGVILEAYHVSLSSVSKIKSPTFKVNEKVWGTWLGAFATCIVAPESSLHLLPPTVSLRDAAGLGASTAPVSYGALVRIAKLKKGETCLIHAAAGGLGVVAVQIACAVGAKVIGTVGSEAKMKVIEKLLQQKPGTPGMIPEGSGVVRYDEPSWEDRVKQITNGRGVDVVFDTVGLVGKSIRCCAFNARVVVIGFVGRGGKMEKLSVNRVLLKQIQLLGYRFGETSRRNPEENIETWKGLDGMLNRGEIKPVIHQEFVGLDQVPAALKMMTKREVAGKVVVQIDEEKQLESTPNPGLSRAGEERAKL